jgi:precorrin-3B synthase
MTATARIEVRGWCPGAVRPMESGDGLIARIRPWCGAFSTAEARGLADIAGRLGNGHIDLTRRANLQIRGLQERDIPELHAGLARLGLLDGEAGRNIMVGPLAGIDSGAVDVRSIARELAGLLAFGFVVDGGGIVSIAGERADVALRAVGDAIAVRRGTTWIGWASPRDAASVAHALARESIGLGATPALPSLDGDMAFASGGPLGVLPLGAVGIAAPFGRIEADTLHRLLDLLDEAGELRLSPWRALYIPARTGERLVEGARALGLIVSSDDPLLRVDACPGAPACRSATVTTRDMARRLAQEFTGSIHVSGCAKGCARTGPADLVLVGSDGRYGVVRGGTARDVPERFIDG